MGIVGSADGPTTVIVTGSPGPVLLLLALLILGAGTLAWLLIRKHRK